MNWITDFFTPLFLVVFILGLIVLLFFIFIRAFRKLWIKSWKFKLKYKFGKYNEDDIKKIMEISETETRDTLEMKLFVGEVKQERVNELLYIYDMLQRVKIKQAKKEIKAQRKRSK